jgi:hydrogenase expression/formation protein HypD
MGYWEYPPLTRKYNVPIVVTGFEPLDIVQGILMVARQLEDGRTEVENAYPRVVKYEGNRPAQDVINKAFMERDQNWRGIGLIPGSGWRLRPEYIDFDAENKFNVQTIKPQESSICIAGEILQGLKRPSDCPAFSTQCTPENPLGATMVSSEGACAAYYRYGL